jgi:competence protein ComEA
MSDSPVVPRPADSGDGRALAERVRALRGDARVGIAVLLCVSVAAGVAWFRAGIAPASPAATSSSGPATTAGSTTTAPAVTTTTTAQEIVVDVVGAVRVPGVVRLPATARVVDAIRAAGGETVGADLERLNLAAKLGDGARVAVPFVGQLPPAVDPGAVTGAAGPSTDGSIDGSADPGAPVNVNTASQAQLEELPGIGPTLAAAIVAEREQNGPFRSPDDLTRVHGIGDGRLAQLRALVTV